ncbi:MAG: L-lactate dehydrogenase [Wenzhouxiangella sp.]
MPIKPCPATPEDYREQARRRLPRFLFDYVDGGAGREQTLDWNARAWGDIHLRQRVLVDVGGIDTRATVLGQDCGLPLALSPIGLGGMTARRGEVQAVRAAEACGVPFTLSTVGLCGLDEVARAAEQPFWFQLYMLKDRAVVRSLLDQAWQVGCRNLLFTVDLPMPGSRQRDVRNGVGMPGFRPKLLKITQLLSRPGWIWNVALRGKPLSLGSMSPYVKAASNPDDFKHWVDQQFDPSVTWGDIAWLRESWKGRLVLKGVLDAADVKPAIEAGVDGLVVSNHGGRQLDGVPATADCLPRLVEAAEGRLELLVDGGIRSGIDVFRALALGANGVMMGRPWVWALAGGGQAGLERLLAAFQDELRIAMALTGVTRVADIGLHCLDRVSASHQTP